MRLLIALLIASVVTQTTLAEPGWWGDFTSSIKNSISSAVEKIQELYKKALKEYPFLENALKELEKEILKSGSTLRSYLQAVQQFVNSVEKQVENLLKFIDEKLEFVSIKVAEVLLREASGLQKWANSTLEKINVPEKRDQAEKIIRGFMNRSIVQINKCAKPVTKPIHEIYSFVNSIALEATAIVKKVINTVESCSKEKEIKGCADLILRIVKEGKNLIIMKIEPIQSKLKDIITKTGINLSSCMATAKIVIEIQKAAVSARIKSLKVK